jgi:hypothetical protein
MVWLLNSSTPPRPWCSDLDDGVDPEARPRGDPLHHAQGAIGLDVLRVAGIALICCLTPSRSSLDMGWNTSFLVRPRGETVGPLAAAIDADDGGPAGPGDALRRPWGGCAFGQV